MVEEIHKRQRSRGHAAGGSDPVFARAQTAEGEAGAAAALVNSRHLAEGGENRIEIVLHRQDETGGQLTVWQSGVHQRRRIGQELKPVHALVKARLPVAGIFTVELRRLGNCQRDAREHAVGALNDGTVIVVPQITLAENFHCGLRKLRWRLLSTSWRI